MKICFVASSMHRDGAERVMSILCNDWINKGHSVTLIVTQTEAISGYPLDSRIHFISIIDKLKARHPHLGIIKNLRKIFEVEKPDCVISFYNDVCALAAISLVGTRIPLIYSERNDPNRTNQRTIDKIFRAIVEKTGTGFVFQTEGARKCYSQKIQKKSIVIVNPINVDSLPDWKENADEKFIISVGRLTKQKRHDVSIKAFTSIAKDYPDYNYRIYGVGELEKEINKLIQDSNMESRIKLCGSNPDVLQIVAKSSLFVLSSDYEGIPNVLVEALSIGVPCISTDCSPGGAREFIINGTNGLLVPCNDVKSLENAMRKVLGDRSLARGYGEESVKTRELVKVENISKIWLDFLSEIISRSNK